MLFFRMSGCNYPLQGLFFVFGGKEGYKNRIIGHFFKITMSRRETMSWGTERYIKTTLESLADRLNDHLDPIGYSAVKHAIDHFLATLNDRVCRGAHCMREQSEDSAQWCDLCQYHAYWTPDRD